MWRAELDGRKLTFRLTGINNQNFLMEDEQTGSWWQQVSGEAVFGPLKGRRLDLVFHDEVSFAVWKSEHPGGRVLRPDDSAPWREFSENWEEETARLPVVGPTRNGEPFPPRELIVGVRAGKVTRAYPMAELLRENPVVDELGGVPLILVVGEDGVSVRAFERTLDGRELNLFRKPDVSPLRMVDSETGSEWDFAGRAVGGPLAGKKLRKVFVLKDYWFHWKAYNPGTTVFKQGIP